RSQQLCRVSCAGYSDFGLLSAQRAVSPCNLFMKCSTFFEIFLHGSRPSRRSSTKRGSRTDKRPNLIHTISVSRKNFSISLNKHMAVLHLTPVFLCIVMQEKPIGSTRWQ